MNKAFLPGTPGQRISDLRNRVGLNQTELAEKLGISKSTLSRIESGETVTVNSDIVTKLTEMFGVSADFILGLSDNPVKTEDIGLRLPEKAVHALAEGDIDMNALGSILSADGFPAVSKCVGQYLSGTLGTGINMHNDIVNMAMNMLSGFPEAKDAAAQIKISPNEERRQVMNRIQQLLIQMKKDSAPGKSAEADSETVKRIFREVQAKAKKQPVTPSVIADVVLKNVSRTCGIDLATLEDFRQPIEKLIGGKMQ